MKKLMMRIFLGCLLTAHALHLGSAQQRQARSKRMAPFAAVILQPRGTVLLAWPDRRVLTHFTKLFDAPPALVRVTVFTLRHFVRAAAAAVRARVQMVNH